MIKKEIEMNEDKLKYPIGEFEKPAVITDEIISGWIDTIERFPQKITDEIENLNSDELKFTYRPKGWTIQQIVHHCADSHMNSFIRFKLALTEENPTIKPYFEDRWAEHPDYLDCSVILSLIIINGLHARWVILLKNLSSQDLNKTFYHPETKQKISLRENIGIYAWHCNHHLEHIKLAKSNSYKS